MKSLPAAALIAGMTLVGPANAQGAAKMNHECNATAGSFCVYDQGGNLLGVSQQAGILNREINGKLYFAGYGANGLITDLALFFALPNCTGTPMVQSGYIGADGVTVVAEADPKWARFDGQSFWGEAGPSEIASPTCNVCYGVVCNGNPEGVPMPFQAAVAPYYPAYAPAAVIETPRLVEPSAACTVGQNCITVK